MESLEIEKILRNDIFVYHDLTDNTEIKYNELSEILEEITSVLYNSSYYKIVDHRTIEFLTLLEKLGIVNNRDKELYQLKVFDERTNEGRELNSWIYAKNLEEPTDDLLNGNEIFKWEVKHFTFCLFCFVQKEPSEIT